MRCHYCDREATFTAATGGVKVGLCRRHFGEQVEKLSTSQELERLRDRLESESS